METRRERSRDRRRQKRFSRGVIARRPVRFEKCPGIAQLQTWLKNHTAERLHVCLEATGGWSEQVAISMGEAGHVVSIVNPARIKAFAQSEMVRTKTDRIDAGLIARFCRLHQPEPWTPPAPEVRMLQGLVRRQHSLNRYASRGRKAARGSDGMRCGSGVNRGHNRTPRA